jgi:hypothetical protein
MADRDSITPIRGLSYAIQDPVRLSAQPVGIADDRWALTAVDANGNRLMIVASRERFHDAFFPKSVFGPVMSEAEQVTAMFVRDEVDVDVLERTIERELRR